MHRYSLHLFSHTTYIKFMSSKHSFFMIFVGQIWEKTCKKRFSGTNHCVCYWPFLGKIYLLRCVDSSDNVSPQIVVLAKRCGQERANLHSEYVFIPINELQLLLGGGPLMLTCYKWLLGFLERCYLLKF